MKRFDPATLFARPRASRTRVPYPTRRAALDGVAAGTKAVMMDTAAPGSRDFAALVRDAHARDLAVVVHGAHVYALRLDDTWRIAALDALRAATDTWSDAAEMQQSLLLGYTTAQRTAWLAQYRAHQAAWGAATIYALLDAAQLKAVRALGMRCFGEPAAIFWHRTNVLAPRRLPAGQTLVRAGLDWQVAERAFGARRGFATAPVTATINGALRSNLEVLTPRGWK